VATIYHRRITVYHKFRVMDPQFYYILNKILLIHLRI
jgi:hypothetical protein